MKMRVLFTLGLLMTLSARVMAQSPIVINEIHSDPSVKTELVEFIELYNNSGAEIDLSNWAFTEGVTYTFPAGTRIPARGFAVVAENPGHFQQKFSRAAYGPWTGKLSSEGETITLRNAAGNVADEVDYGLGFPWPIVGDESGPSMELVNPDFDNNLGGHWRPSGSGAPGGPSITHDPNWRYFKGTSEASSPASAWRQLNFNDGSWLSGAGPLGFGENFITTPLSDMRNNYTTVFLRRGFDVADPAALASLTLQILFDDGVNVWINGQHVLRNNLSSAEMAYNATASLKSETQSYEQFDVSSVIPFLVKGRNVLAVQAVNTHISTSSDFYIDAQLAVGASASTLPTPGRANSVFSANMGPTLRQVSHQPEQPRGGQPVTISIKATDPDGVGSVKLYYQVVNPGAYIEMSDSAFATSWTEVAMRDDGAGGDALANDATYTAVLPANIQQHRRLVRYRFATTDAGGRVSIAPQPEDPVPNFAYFVYDGVPAWSGAIQPGSTDATRRQVVTYSAEEMSRLPVYHLISKSNTVTRATWTDRYGGEEYPYRGTLVYDGVVYDHIGFRARGGVWRYAMGKNMWKFDLNRGHSFQARDNWGRLYNTTWRKVNLGANIQQGDYLHRGEQGMFESVGLRLFNLAGIEGPKTHWAQLRIIDEPAEAGSSQYQGDFWGLYLAIEQEDGRFLDEHDLPDGNLYKMEGGTGELNNLGFLGPSNKSDLNSFQNAYRNNQTDAWWRANFDLDRYYNYHAIVQGIHHYDISFGKNYFYYRNPETGRWSVHPWDLDLTWADNMYEPNSGGRDDFTPVLSRPAFNIEWENRVRELRDLLFNDDQAHQLIDEYANIAKGPNAASIIGADRAMWDYNPVMTSGLVNSGKAGAGRFYRFEYESRTNSALQGSFDVIRQIMKLYVNYRGARMDALYGDTAIPQRPTIQNAGSPLFAANAVQLRSSAYAGGSPFAAIKWRVAEITPEAVSPRWPVEPRKYEIEADWESPEITSQNLEIAVPGHVLRPGRTYRARVKMKDSAGRWSHWSAPLTFIATEPENAQSLVDHLRITELMYDPVGGNEFEFVELHNSSATVALDLAGVSFTAGISFTFTNLTLPPLGFVVLHKAGTPEELAAFEQRYPMPESALLAGPFSGNLNNGGEEIRLRPTLSGRDIAEFQYRDNHHWPMAADGAGHSLVAESGGPLSYHGSWRASALPGGSPGKLDPEPPRGLQINELMANTSLSDPNHPERDSNDWIEIRNPLAAPVSTAGYFLSDDPANLRKWPLPAQTLAAGDITTYYEIGGFRDPITSGFGLSSNGERLYLSYAEGALPAQVIDAVRFEGQPLTASWGRAPGSPDVFAALTPTPNAPNQPLPPSVVITEVMYDPPTNTVAGAAGFEFVELQNTGASPAPLGSAAGSWRISGGLDFTFPQGTQLAAGEVVVLTSFDPADTVLLNSFRQQYALPANARVFGPFTGRLDNQSDLISLESPIAPEIAGGAVAWVIVDEVAYAGVAPWPVDARDDGRSIHRRSAAVWGAVGANWQSGAATPGVHEAPSQGVDTDNDGMPDVWENAHGLNPNLDDAHADLDGDGLSNLSEFRAGTLPNDATSSLRFSALTHANGLVTLRFTTMPNRVYRVEGRASLAENAPWTLLEEFNTAGATQPSTATYVAPTDVGERYFRVVIPE